MQTQRKQLTRTKPGEGTKQVKWVKTLQVLCCYLGERNVELLKLLSPLHKLSENKSASFPSP